VLKGSGLRDHGEHGLPHPANNERRDAGDKGEGDVLAVRRCSDDEAMRPGIPIY